MVGTKGCRTVGWRGAPEAGLCQEGRLRRASRTLESQVIAEQHGAVGMITGHVHNARRGTGFGCDRSACANPFGRQRTKDWSVTGVKA